MWPQSSVTDCQRSFHNWGWVSLQTRETSVCVCINITIKEIDQELQGAVVLVCLRLEQWHSGLFIQTFGLNSWWWPAGIIVRFWPAVALLVFNVALKKWLGTKAYKLQLYTSSCLPKRNQSIDGWLISRLKHQFKPHWVLGHSGNRPLRTYANMIWISRVGYVFFHNRLWGVHAHVFTLRAVPPRCLIEQISTAMPPISRPRVPR